MDNIVHSIMEINVANSKYIKGLRNDGGHSLASEVYRLEKDCAVLVFDEDFPEGSFCSSNGKWPTLFNEEDAHEFVKAFSEQWPESTYMAFRLHQLGL